MRDGCGSFRSQGGSYRVCSEAIWVAHVAKAFQLAPSAIMNVGPCGGLQTVSHVNIQIHGQSPAAQRRRTGRPRAELSLTGRADEALEGGHSLATSRPASAAR